MNANELETLLERIRDGIASDEEFARAQALLAADEAEAPLGLGDAVLDEAGLGIDFADAVMSSIDLGSSAEQDFDLPVAEAVRAEAGSIDIADSVIAAVAGRQAAPEWLSALLDHELTEESHRGAALRLVRERGAAVELTEFADLGRFIRDAVPAEAGPAPDVWPGVARAIGVDDPEAVPGWDGRAFAEAVRAEAGSIDIVDEVMHRVRRQAVGPSTAIPAPANRGFTWGAVAAVAAVFGLVITLGRGFLPGADVPADAPVQPVQFASAEEIRLEFPTEAQAWVEVPDAEERPLIIWVEEEASL